LAGRSPHRERGLKPGSASVAAHMGRRSPHRERGLKQDIVQNDLQYDVSLPSPGAWIETSFASAARFARRASLPSPGAWIETGVRGA